VFAVGIIAFKSERFPGWIGWGSIILAIGLLLARWVWTSSIAFAPYVFFWIWMIAMGITTLRRNRLDVQTRGFVES
jgi:hypothetical protein